MKFRFIDPAKTEFPAYRLCKVLGVSQSGYFAWKDRPASRRQHEDMVMLAHVRSAYALSHETYGSPRMTRELQDCGFAIGRRRTARLMRENGLHARQKRRFKRTTVSQYAFPVAPISSIRILQRPGQTRNAVLIFLRVDPRGLALSCRCHRPVLSPRRRLGCR